VVKKVMGLVSLTTLAGLAAGLPDVTLLMRRGLAATSVVGILLAGLIHRLEKRFFYFTDFTHSHK